MPLSHHGHRGRATASPALYHAQPPNPTFLPHHSVHATPTSPRPPPESPPPESPPPDPARGIPPAPGSSPPPAPRAAPASGLRSRPAPDPGAGPMERHETPDPVRSDAMDPRFHCVRGPAPAPSHGVRQQAAPAPTPRNPPARTRVPAERTPNPNANRAQPLIRGKPFLTASNTPADYAELPTARPGPERIEGVSRSLPFSDLLALTSSHMFFSVMN